MKIEIEMISDLEGRLRLVATSEEDKETLYMMSVDLRSSIGKHTLDLFAYETFPDKKKADNVCYRINSIPLRD